MTAIWKQTTEGAWAVQQPAPFPNEAALHDMVMKSPELLPLSGGPRLTVVGREVAMRGSGYADVLAVEPDGRPVIVEVKLRNNAESRRAVVAQALSYAASLHGLTVQEFEESVLRAHPAGRSLFDVVLDNVQDESLTQQQFEEGLTEHLTAGSFRVAIVLDDAPTELVTLVGYLESVTTGLSLDLIVINAYTIGEHHIAVPQRLDPEHLPEVVPSRPPRPAATKGRLEPGLAPFRDWIADAEPEYQPTLRMLADWADTVAGEAAIAPETFFAVAGDVILLPRFTDTKTGLVSVWRYPSGSPAISFWRTVFEKRAPGYIDEVERLIGKPISVGNQSRDVTRELLEVLRAAYVAGSQVRRD